MTPLAVIDQICPDTLQGWRDGWQDGGVEAWLLEMGSREVDISLGRVCPGALWLSQWPAQENSHDGRSKNPSAYFGFAPSEPTHSPPCGPGN